MIVREVEAMTHSFVSHGGKTNRRQQRKRMIALAKFARKNAQVRHIGSLGKKHVIDYYKAHRHLSDATLYNHYRAFCVLFQLAKKAECPKPFFDH